MERVAEDPWARKRVIFDIMNEPDARAMHVRSPPNSLPTYPGCLDHKL